MTGRLLFLGAAFIILIFLLKSYCNTSFYYFAPMKVFLATFFLAIFSLQVLPVKELGKILYKGTMTEELAETEAETEGKTEGFTEKWNANKEYNTASASSRTLLMVRYTAIVALTVHSAQYVFRQYIPDITTPPPNLA